MVVEEEEDDEEEENKEDESSPVGTWQKSNSVKDNGQIGEIGMNVEKRCGR